MEQPSIRNISTSSIFWTLIAFFGMHTLAQAETTLVAEVSEASHTGYEATLSAPMPFGSFGTDYSELGDDLLTFIWKAPPGKCIEIVTPETLDDYVEFSMRFSAGGSYANTGSYIDSSAAIEFVGLEGTLTALDSSLIQLTGPSGSTARLSFRYTLMPGQVVRFESVSLSTTVPASYNHDFSETGISRFDIFGEGGSAGSPPDTGQWIRLVDKVDPLAGRKAALKRKIKKLKRQIKKARRKGDRRARSRLSKALRRVKRTLRQL